MTRRSEGGTYPPNWHEVARQVKAEAGGCCIRCGHAHSPADGYTLTVHHLDMNPANCAWWNLVALCQRCHLTIQGRVVMERPWMLDHTPWFKAYVAGHYAALFALPGDREWVLAHVDELIDMGQGRRSALAVAV